MMPEAPVEHPASRAGLINGMIFAVALIVVAGIFYLNSGDEPAVHPTPGIVTYHVSSTTSRVHVMYENNSGGNDTVDQLPMTATAGGEWAIELRMKPGAFLYVTAQNQQDSSETVVAEIRAGGQVLKRSESHGPYCIATASASLE